MPRADSTHVNKAAETGATRVTAILQRVTGSRKRGRGRKVFVCYCNTSVKPPHPCGYAVRGRDHTKWEPSVQPGAGSQGSAQPRGRAVLVAAPALGPGTISLSTDPWPGRAGLQGPGNKSWCIITGVLDQVQGSWFKKLLFQWQLLHELVFFQFWVKTSENSLGLGRFAFL